MAQEDPGAVRCCQQGESACARRDSKSHKLLIRSKWSCSPSCTAEISSESSRCRPQCLCHQANGLRHWVQRTQTSFDSTEALGHGAVGGTTPALKRRITASGAKGSSLTPCGPPGTVVGQVLARAGACVIDDGACGPSGVSHSSHDNTAHKPSRPRIRGDAS